MSAVRRPVLQLKRYRTMTGLWQRLVGARTDAALDGAALCVSFVALSFLALWLLVLSYG
jgi:hypothetical protein